MIKIIYKVNKYFKIMRKLAYYRHRLQQEIEKKEGSQYK